MTQQEGRPLISSIYVENLFGRRSYEIVVPSNDAGGVAGRLLLLHGDNGSGKTTILRLVWNLLSSADDRGHRTFIARTPFSLFIVDMTDGSQIRVEKKDGLVGSFSLDVARKDREDIHIDYVADDQLSIRSPSTMPRSARLWSSHFEFSESNRLRSTKIIDPATSTVIDAELQQSAAEFAYFDFLDSKVRTPLFLADDRSLYSDDPDINRTRDVLQRREDHLGPDRLARLVFLELQVTIHRVNELLRGLTLGGQNDGSANSNAIYLNVLKQFVEPQIVYGDVNVQGPTLFKELEEIGRVAPSYEKYELVPNLDVGEFRFLLQRIAGTDLEDTARRVISPFISSMRARYAALKDAHDTLEALVPTINSFLIDKEMYFTPRGGLRIITAEGEPLDVESLSSGERQLVMLLCTTLLARSDARLFIIDEPELSLGVEWQRKILGALLELTDGTGLQFMVATHSIEIISPRLSSVVSLSSQRG